ncbi:hypothetical protein BT96DRAFT_1006068 [Gymnopus androsaceus JB14]|uniref:Uncharacterized protein n=1 Tax=Gymnopus androsaceus JB14 TaxID=1447944 RepID=A0A6A4GMC0_9AGAR|nr:hypothetical protein BT96DRAFT_1006068 [Gymnopus androsaceus JB14]
MEIPPKKKDKLVCNDPYCCFPYCESNPEAHGKMYPSKEHTVTFEVGPPSGSHSLLPEPSSTSPGPKGTAPEPSASLPVAGSNLTAGNAPAFPQSFGTVSSIPAYPVSPCMVNVSFLTISSKNPSTAPGAAIISQELASRSYGPSSAPPAAFTTDVTPSFDGSEPLMSSATLNAVQAGTQDTAMAVKDFRAERDNPMDIALDKDLTKEKEQEEYEVA